MGEIVDKLVPENFPEKLKSLFNIFEETFSELCSPKLEEIKHIFDKDYISEDAAFKDEVIDTLMDLFGFEVQDYSYFDENKRALIKKNWFNNIFIFYKDRLKADLYIKLFYVYEIQAIYYNLVTTNWVDYYRVSSAFDLGLVTDIGFNVDEGIAADDQIYRTPFLEIEFNLDKLYDNQHYQNNIFRTMYWFKDIDDSIKKDIENIRYVLTKAFYTLRIDLIGRLNETINYYPLITSEITKLTFTDDTSNSNANYNSEYIDLYVGVNLHRFWWDVDNTGVAPADGGGTLHEIDILSTDVFNDVISKSSIVIDAVSGLISDYVSGNDNFSVTHTEGVTTDADGSNSTMVSIEITNKGVDDDVSIWVSSFYDHATVHNYKIIFDDDSEYADIIEADFQLDEDDDYYYIGVVQDFNEVKFVKKFEVYTVGSDLLVEVDFPYAYLAQGDKIYFYIRIEK